MNSYMDFSSLVQQKEINISYKYLCDADLIRLTKVLQKSKVLKKLDLLRNSITLAEGQFVDVLARNQYLRLLDLGGNKIGDEGAKRLATAIKENRTLETMYLDLNEIGDEGAKSLADALGINTSLEEIELAGNQIGDAGAKHLAKSLTKNKSLRKMWIGDNLIGDRGGQSFVDALKSNHSTQSLLLGGNKISKSVMKRITAILRDRKRKALTSKLNKQASTHGKASDGGGSRDAGQKGDRHKVGSEISSPRCSKKQKKGKPNDASNADDAAGRAAVAGMCPQEIVQMRGATAETESEGAKPVARSVPPSDLPKTGAKAAVAVKREETEAEDLEAETEDEDQGAEPLYVTYEDVRPLYDQVKAKSSSAHEREFYGHIREFLENKGRHVLVSEFNLVQEFMGKFESLLQDHARAVDKGEARLCESFLVGIIEQCKTKLQLQQHRGDPK